MFKPLVSSLATSTQLCDVKARGLGLPCAYGLTNCSAQGFSPGLALFSSHCFPLYMFCVLLTPTYYHLYCSFGFTLWSTLLSQGPCFWGHCPSTHCLLSWSFLSNLGGSFHDPAALIFCIPVKLASCGPCQGVLPA